MKNGTSEPIASAIFASACTRQFGIEQFVERKQGGSGVAAPSAQTRAVRNLLFQLDRNTAVDVCSLEKQVRRAHGEVIIPFRHRWIVTLKLDYLFCRYTVQFESRRTAKSVR